MPIIRFWFVYLKTENEDDYGELFPAVLDAIYSTSNDEVSGELVAIFSPRKPRGAEAQGL